jgi:iron complex transport system permease protein
MLRSDSRRKALLAGALFAAAAVAFGADLFCGSVSIAPDRVLSALFGGDGGSPQERIVLAFRLPRAATALLAGAALAASGLLMQTLFENPLAGSFVLGVDSGAGLGVALLLLAADSLGAGLSRLVAGGVAAASWAGSLAVLAVILLASKRVSSNTTLLILGLMFGYAAGSLVTVLLHFSSGEQAHGYLAWSFGSFSATTGAQVAVMAAGILPSLAAAFFLAKPLNALLLGERYARSMGVPIGRLRKELILTTALLSGSVTAYCGPVAFLGIATPHLCRALLRTEDHRWLLPACAAAGSLLALAADLASRAGGGVALPVNAITSLLGAPVVVWVVLRGGARS